VPEQSLVSRMYGGGGPFKVTTESNFFARDRFSSPKLFVGVAAGLLALFLVFFNLRDYPKPWFDEGSHLHVPKALVLYGKYADYSSEGFRYYGPTIGVGPAVMLPVAASFKLFGVALLQARIVMCLYLFASIYVFYRLVCAIAGSSVAWVACALLVSSRSVLLIYYGRQLLGEVPGLLFVMVGLWLWFLSWEKPDWLRLGGVGLLFGLAIVTKYQYLLFLAPALGLAWLSNLAYYRTKSHRHFIVPLVMAIATFASWQVFTVFYLGPSTALENLQLLQNSAAGAAFTFDPVRMSNNLGELMARSVYLGALLPALIYGTILSLPRDREGQKSGILLLLVTTNLVWYVVASVGWIRYAFLGLAIASIFVARLFHDVTDGFCFRFQRGEKGGTVVALIASCPVRWAFLIWLALVVFLPLGKTIAEIAAAGPNAAEAMAAYLDAEVPKNVVIETWEPEIGFFSGHRFHYPPNSLLAAAVRQAYGNGPPIWKQYDFVVKELPDYVLVGEFGRWVGLYPKDDLARNYTLVKVQQGFELYKLSKR
jgi:4-amino-4-deoxy-L-arabinose transferase-like glycosyltransferase